MDALALILFVLVVLGFTAAIAQLSVSPAPRPNAAGPWCATCDYSLIGLAPEGICPECGSEYAPGDPQPPPCVPSTPARTLLVRLPVVAMLANFVVVVLLQSSDSISSVIAAGVMACIPLSLAWATASAAVVYRPTSDVAAYSIVSTIAAWLPALLGSLGVEHHGCIRPSPLSTYTLGSLAGVGFVMAAVGGLWLIQSLARRL